MKHTRYFVPRQRQACGRPNGAGHLNRFDTYVNALIVVCECSSTLSVRCVMLLWDCACPECSLGCAVTYQEYLLA